MRPPVIRCFPALAFSLSRRPERSHSPFRMRQEITLWMERLAKGDPRLSLEERYGSHAAYVQCVREVVHDLLQARLLLPEDAAQFVHAATQRDPIVPVRSLRANMQTLRCSLLLGAALLAGMTLTGPRAVTADDPAPAGTTDRELAAGLRTALDALQKLGSSSDKGEGRNRAVGALVTALDRVTSTARGRSAAPPTGPDAAEVGKLLAQAAALEVLAVLPAAFQAAAWFGHPTSVTGFQTAGERLLLFPGEPTRAYLATARDVGSLDARRAFVTDAAKIFGAGPLRDEALRKEFRSALDACAAAAGAPPEGAPPAAATALLVALEAAAKTPDEELFADVALALARAPSEGPRAVLRRTLKARKATRETTLIAILEGLASAGDAEAVPLLLTYVPGTPGPVFEAAYFGLWQCKADGLRPHAKEALAVLIPILHEEGYAANAMSGAATPKALRVRERVAVVARLAAKMAGDDKEAGRGWWALLWKLVDAGGGALKASPPPPDRKGWTHVAGRVTALGTDAWVAWWKTVK